MGIQCYNKTMSRVKFIGITQNKFLKSVQERTGLGFQQLADICGVHRRSFSDWKYDKYLMPFSVFKKLVEIGGIDSPKVGIFEEYWYTKQGGRAGGLAVYKKYGKVPGWTREASRRGGLKAAETLRRRGAVFF